MNLEQTQNKKDYRKPQIIFSHQEREEIKARAYKLLAEVQGGVQVYLADMLFVSKNNINMAFAGSNMKLLARIKNFIEAYEVSPEEAAIYAKQFQRTI